MKHLPFVLFVSLLALGCGPAGPDRETYAKEWKSIAEQYLAVGQQHLTEPLLVWRGLSRDQVLQKVSEMVMKDAADFDPLISRAKALRPPKGLEAHKSVLVDILEGTARTTREFGEAVKTGSKEKRDAAGERQDRFLLSSMDRLIKVSTDLGMDALFLKEQRSKLAGSRRG